MKKHMAVSIKGARIRLADPSTRNGVKGLFGVNTNKEVVAILDEAEAKGLELIPFDSCTDYDSTGRCNGHPSVLPMSLRTAAGEEAYYKAKERGELRDLQDEPSIIEFKYWRIIANRYPYNAPYKTSHMMLPRRSVPTYNKLNWRERRELRKIIDTYCQANYHKVEENMAVRRSVMAVWHLHLLTFVDTREEFTV